MFLLNFFLPFFWSSFFLFRLTDSRDGVSRLPQQPRVPLVGGRVEVAAGVADARGRPPAAQRDPVLRRGRGEASKAAAAGDRR